MNVTYIMPTFQPVDAYYVDSNASQSGSGRSSASPFKTLAELPTSKFTARTKVRLARGSTFYETLTVPCAGLTVEAYGSGNKPIIDCMDEASSDGWSLSSDKTYTYERVLTPEQSGSHPTYMRVQENGVAMVLVANATAVEATAGTYAVSSHTAGGNITFYIHPSDDGDPSSNGKKYEYTERAHAIVDWSAYGYVTVRNVVCKRQGGADGSAVLGRYSIVDGCEFNDGSKHNLYMMSNGTVRNCSLNDAYVDGTVQPSASLLVFNENVAVSGQCTVTGCTFTAPVARTLVTAIHAHYNTSGTFGTIVVENCTVSNLGKLWSAIHCTGVIRNCTVSACVSIAYLYTGLVSLTVDACTLSCTTRAFTLQDASMVLVIQNGTTCAVTSGEHIYGAAATPTVTIEDSTLGAGTYSIYLTGVAVVTVNGSTIGTGTNFRYRLPHASSTFTGDNNTYPIAVDQAKFRLNNEMSLTFAQWQALVAPQEAASVRVAP